MMGKIINIEDKRKYSCDNCLCRYCTELCNRRCGDCKDNNYNDIKLKDKESCKDFNERIM